MKLVGFAVKNYRSIQSTPKIALSQLTVLVGPNNEGKSNLLSALVCALSLVQETSPTHRRTLLGSSNAFNPERDFPVGLKKSSAKLVTRFDLEFELDAADQKAFTSAVGSKLNGTLPIQLSVDRDGTIQYAVKKQGPVQKLLTQKREIIARFISGRLQFQYIPAVRDEEQSKAIVEDMVSRALAALQTNQDYQRALKALEAIELPVLAQVSAALQESLQAFVPSLTRVVMEVRRDRRVSAMRRSTEVLLDDGTMTPLSQKGDGIKSLVAIALAKATAENRAGNKNLILAIEEPEAHLHSGAVHTLRALLEGIAQKRQVIISTHEPALVRRDDVAANILVERNKAAPATSLEEVRRVLGVRLAENLVSPDVVVLVEGQSDVDILAALMRHREPALANAVATGRFRFAALQGAGNLPYQLRLYHSLVASPIAFVDHDVDGNNALAKARADGLLDQGAEFCAVRPGLQESELEDLLHPDLYSSQICANLGIASLKPKAANVAGKKWSRRLEQVLKESGKPVSEHDRLIAAAKWMIGQRVMASPATALIEGLSGPVDALFAYAKVKLDIA